MIPSRFTEAVYALFRVVFGLLFIMHGLQKLVGMFGGLGGGAVPLGSLLGAASVIECTTGTLILLGLFTRYAARERDDGGGLLSGASAERRRPAAEHGRARGDELLRVSLHVGARLGTLQHRRSDETLGA